jgi:23S rRNA (adenine2503-C2)-methyltransferase
MINRLAQEHYKQDLTNIVYMGMGEPLLNYANTMRSTERIIAEDGLGMGARRITVSTAGIAKMIRRLADDDAKFNLALSLHAATDAKRDRIMPINEQNSLGELKDALRYYARVTRRPVTFEYILLRGFNDSLEDARALVRYASDVHAKVNLIEYNPIDGSEFGRTENKDADAFQQYLDGKGIIARIRRSRGRDIDAACGQLANKNDPALKSGEVVLKA